MMDNEKRMTAGKFVRAGYEVQPTANGGFFVMLPKHNLSDGRYATYATDSASFTNSTDFLAWLSAGHAEYDKEIVR